MSRLRSCSDTVTGPSLAASLAQRCNSQAAKRPSASLCIRSCVARVSGCTWRASVSTMRRPSSGCAAAASAGRRAAAHHLHVGQRHGVLRRVAAQPGAARVEPAGALHAALGLEGAVGRGAAERRVAAGQQAQVARRLAGGHEQAAGRQLAHLGDLLQSDHDFGGQRRRAEHGRPERSPAGRRHRQRARRETTRPKRPQGPCIDVAAGGVGVQAMSPDVVFDDTNVSDPPGYRLAVDQTHSACLPRAAAGP